MRVSCSACRRTPDPLSAWSVTRPISSTAARQNRQRFIQTHTRHKADLAAIMEERHDIQADVLMRVRNDSHDLCDALLVAKIHDPLDVWDAGQVHCLQGA